MRELPILFSAPMVLAILEGRKTVTRRVVKAAPTGVGSYVLGVHQGVWGIHEHIDALEAFRARCPYGQPGDRMWVRETWRTDSGLDMQKPSSFCAWPVKYVADNSTRTCGALFGNTNGKTRVSIHMPRWASRITLDVTSVRVERLQEITEEQAIAEGIERDETHPELWKRGPLRRDIRLTPWTGFPKLAFQALWEGINGTGSWDANPWVWVVSFKRVTP